MNADTLPIRWANLTVLEYNDDMEALGPKPKRRLLRFSLRTLLLLMLVVCAALGWKVEQARKQKEAVEWVQDMGGLVWYAYQDDEYPLNSDKDGPWFWVPDRLKERIGLDFHDTVVSVQLHKPKGSDLAPLTKLTNLRSLVVYSTHVSDVGPLSGLTKLEHLHLERVPVSDITPLARLTRLEELRLVRMPVSNLSPLAKLTGLKILNLRGTEASDISPLAGLKNLEELRLGDTYVSQEATDQLTKSLPQCEIIWSVPLYDK